MLFDVDHWREIGAGLAANKTRTLLTAFGVAWGIFMLLVMLGSGNGLERGVRHDFFGRASNAFYVWTRSTSVPWRGLPAGRWFNFRNDDTAALERVITDADVVAPRRRLGGFRSRDAVRRHDKTGAFNVTGDVPAIRFVEPIHLRRGRFLNPLDLEEHRKVAVIGSAVVSELFEPDEDPLGESITIGSIPFRVVGTFESPRSGDEGDRDAHSIHVPLTTVQSAFTGDDIVGWYAITADPGVPASSVERQALRFLARRHGVAPHDTRAFGHFNVEEEFMKIQGLFTGIRTLIWIVGAGTLAAGVIGVSNIMLVIVRERTHEIGIRRAIGATPSSIMSQVVVEALLLTSVAGYLGLVAGVAVLEGTAALLAGQQTTMFRDPGVSLGDALWALLVLVVAGVVAGLLPARRAVAKTPVDALREVT